jgi:hypothetical protein
MLLRSVASWTLGLSLAFAITNLGALMTGMTEVNPIFFSPCLNLALGTGLLGLLLLFLGRKSKQASAGVAGTNNERLRAVSWAITLSFILSILLFVFLLAVPYYSTYPLPIDPKSWPPFSWGEFGLFLKEAATYLWLGETLLLLPFAAVQASILKRVWLGLNRAERITHVSLVGASTVVSLFTATFGQYFLYWLGD